MKLFLDVLKDNENAKVIVGFPKNGSPGVRESITAYISEEFMVGGNAMYSQPGDEAFGGLGRLGSDAINTIGAFAGGAFGKSFVNRQVRTVWSTISTWTGTDKFMFTLTLRFYAMQKGDDVRVPVRRFLECVNPIFDTKIPFMMQAPNAYDFTGNTCIAVKIGKWFKTPPLFLITDTNWRFSKETVTGGNPLYAEGTAKFQSFRQLSAEEVSKFLTGSFTGSEDLGSELPST